jgi:hypothetical protein
MELFFYIIIGLYLLTTLFVSKWLDSLFLGDRLSLTPIFLKNITFFTFLPIILLIICIILAFIGDYFWIKLGSILFIRIVVPEIGGYLALKKYKHSMMEFAQEEVFRGEKDAQYLKKVSSWLTNKNLREQIKRNKKTGFY